MSSEFIKLRQHLHQHPELSQQEFKTAEHIVSVYAEFGVAPGAAGLGGTGLAFVFDSGKTGPTTLIRCELDALPIQETNDLPYQSRVDGVSHKCGHDGHMAIVTALGAELANNPPLTGRVICHYQPAEETGEGAAQVLADPAFEILKPDYAFALHNFPSLPLGEVYCKSGPFNCASCGIEIFFEGKTSHAAHPENGLSPAKAMCRMIEALDQLAEPYAAKWVTVIHALLGEIAFGTSPGSAEVRATLRSHDNKSMDALKKQAEIRAQELAKAQGLSVTVAWKDDFSASINTEEGYQRVMHACQTAGVTAHTLSEGFRWSEDFGKFTEQAQGAMFALGSGEHSPQLHNPDYDFPDGLISIGVSVFRELILDINGLT